MSSKHEQIKKLFLKAIELPTDQQNSFIDHITDADIKKEVAELVKNHITDFTINIQESTKLIAPQESSQKLFLSQIYRILLGNRFKLGTTLFFVSLLILGFGFFSLTQGKKALIKIRNNELTNMIESNQLTMNVWIEEQKKLVEILSNAPAVSTKINKLTTTYGFGRDGNPEIIWNDQTHQSLVDFLQPILTSEGIPLFSVLDKTGYRVATNAKKNLGKQIRTDELATLTPVFSENKIIFSKPSFQRVIRLNTTDTVNVPLTWIDAPIYDSTGKVIATLGLAFYANEGFSKFLNIQKTGKQGESYAFDRAGVLVSHSKHRDILKKARIIKQEQLSILNIKLRNPGVDLKTVKQPPKNYASLPFIVPVADLLAKVENKNDLAYTSSAIYLNYIGQEVIGTAAWLPEYQFGIVTEIPLQEALAPLNNLSLLFIALFIILFSLAIISTLSSFSLFNMHKNTAEKIGPYFIKKKIGEGGMGNVYLAEHQLLKRPTAIKTLKTEFTNNQNEQRFEREVLLASKLTHPNTISIYDFGKTKDGSFYYAMEYLQGIDLTQLSNLCGIVPIDRVVHILLQICYSLKEAHHKGLVHRDIKPQNIMLCYIGDNYDVVKVLDFGLVKDLQNNQQTDLTQLFEIGGTPMYMSPERLTAPQTVDYRTDIYSVGVIAYYLLTAKKPFLTGINDEEIIKQIINESPQEIRDDKMPAAFTELIYKCMKKDPGQRPADMNELIALLNEINTQTWTQSRAAHWWKEKVTIDKSPLT